MAHINPISLDELKAITTNCRVKRHLMSTSTHEHGSPAEAEPDRTIYTQRVKKSGHFSKSQTLFESSEIQRINLIVFAPNAFPLALSPTLSQVD